MSTERTLIGAIAAAGALFFASAIYAQTPKKPAAPAPAPAAKAAAPSAPAAPAADANDPATIASVAAVKERVGKEDYQRAKWDPIHFKPAIDHASDEACLVCHSEILKAKPRAVSPAGVKADEVEAWYQTLDTYAGKQEDFHVRHLSTPFAKQVMDLKCTFCHQGNDVREESPSVTAQTISGQPISSWPRNEPAFTLRKMVNPEETCLRCHGKYPQEVMGLPEPWPAMRESLETPEQPNGCLSCHADQFRTVRHQVSYLKADGIEKLAQTQSDSCYGCHGGRQWYRISYPYPRHPWPGMDPEKPEWATARPTESDARFQLPKK